MSNASPVQLSRSPKHVATAPMLAAALALLLAGCGPSKVEEELLQRVAIAEAAAARANEARIKAEKAVENIGNSEFADDGDTGDESEEAEADESLDVAPDDQGIENEFVPPPDPAPIGPMPG